jgi:hypothetical protein
MVTGAVILIPFGYVTPFLIEEPSNTTSHLVTSYGGFTLKPGGCELGSDYCTRRGPKDWGPDDRREVQDSGGAKPG